MTLQGLRSTWERWKGCIEHWDQTCGLSEVISIYFLCLWHNTHPTWNLYSKYWNYWQQPVGSHFTLKIQVKNCEMLAVQPSTWCHHIVTELSWKLEIINYTHNSSNIKPGLVKFHPPILVSLNTHLLSHSVFKQRGHHNFTQPIFSFTIFSPPVSFPISIPWPKTSLPCVSPLWTAHSHSALLRFNCLPCHLIAVSIQPVTCVISISNSQWMVASSWWWRQ